MKNTTRKISWKKIREIEKFFFLKTKDFFLAFTSKKKILKIPTRFGSRAIFTKKNFSTRKMGKIFFLPKNQPKEAQRANYTYGGYHGPITYQYGNFSPPTQFTPFMVCYTFLM